MCYHAGENDTTLRGFAMKKTLSRLLPALLALLLVLFLFPAVRDTALPAATAATPAQSPKPIELPDEEELPEDGTYTTKEDVCAYLILYGHLPSNFITKREAEAAGWEGGSLEKVLPGMCIGGDRFGNREGRLPKAKGRSWTECDINTLGKRSRGAERIVFSNDGLIYYTGDHYDSFELLYGKP